ncbi:MAG: hypothetical protein ACYDDF_09805 [Thermoplasmatota archaeon]
MRAILLRFLVSATLVIVGVSGVSIASQSTVGPVTYGSTGTTTCSTMNGPSSDMWQASVAADSNHSAGLWWGSYCFDGGNYNFSGDSAGVYVRSYGSATMVEYTENAYSASGYWQCSTFIVVANVGVGSACVSPNGQPILGPPSPLLP